jgi:hypothetical protein
MKRQILMAVAAVSLAACKKDKSNPSTSSGTTTVEYSFTSEKNENCSGYYWDGEGKQQSIINVRSGWTKTIEAKPGNTAQLTLSTNYAGKMIGLIKVNGAIVASDTDNSTMTVQYVIK